jgi:hypothetical protein
MIFFVKINFVIFLLKANVLKFHFVNREVCPHEAKKVNMQGESMMKDTLMSVALQNFEVLFNMHQISTQLSKKHYFHTFILNYFFYVVSFHYFVKIMLRKKN